MHSQTRKFKNNHIEFIIENNEFTVVNKVDYEEGYVRSKTYCDTISKGNIDYETCDFYKIKSNELPKYKFSLKESIGDLHHEHLFIKIVINGFQKLDADNFEFQVINSIDLKLHSDEFKTEITFLYEKRSFNSFTLYLYPNNNSFVLSDKSFYNAYSSILNYILLDITELNTSNNCLEFTIDNFNVCDLYTHKIVNEYVKIENDTLYWRDEILKEVF